MVSSQVLALLALALSHLSPLSEEQPIAVSPGYSAEKSFGPNDIHTYTIDLQEGCALIGVAEQNGVDIAVDVMDPDGKKLLTVDSPNGNQGPEPFDVTAVKSGTYKIVIHSSPGTSDT